MYVSREAPYAIARLAYQGFQEQQSAKQLHQSTVEAGAFIWSHGFGRHASNIAVGVIEDATFFCKSRGLFEAFSADRSVPLRRSREAMGGSASAFGSKNELLGHSLIV